MAYSWDLADMDMDFHGLSWTIIDLVMDQDQNLSCRAVVVGGGWWMHLDYSIRSGPFQLRKQFFNHQRLFVP